MLTCIGIFLTLYAWVFFQDFAVGALGHGGTSVIVLVGSILPLGDILLMRGRIRVRVSAETWILLICWFALAVHFVIFKEEIAFREKYYFLGIYLPIAAIMVTVGTPLHLPTFRFLTVVASVSMFINLLYVAALDPERYSAGERITAGGATASGTVNYIGIAALSLALAWHVVFQKRRLLRYAGALLPVLALVMAKSRGNYVAVAVVAILLLWTSRASWRSRILQSIGVVIGVALTGWIGNIYERFSNVLVTDADYQFGRLQIIADFYQQFAHRWWLGSGIGTNGIALRYDCHNIILELLFEGGVFFFLVYAPLFIEALRFRRFSATRNIGYALYFTHIAIFVSNMFSASFFIVPLFVITYVFLVRFRKFGECWRLAPVPAEGNRLG